MKYHESKIFFSLMTLSVVPFTVRLIEPSFIATAIMSVINVVLSCSRFAAFSHKELAGMCTDDN